MLTFYFSGADGRMTEPEILTTGMVGKQVKLEFSQDWEGLTKTAVFSDGTVIRDAVLTNDIAIIPSEVLTRPLRPFFAGVYGVNSDGTLVIPTIRAVGPRILPGVDPSGDAGTDPDLPIWAQLQAVIGDPAELSTKETASLVTAINELAEEKADKSSVSVYAYAVRGGFTGTEAELMQKLAAESVRTVNGNPPDAAGNITLQEDTVHYTEQTLTEDQQSVARENISAASVTAVETAQSTANTAKTNAASATSKANLAYNTATKASTAANNAQATADEALELAQALSTEKLDAAGITVKTITATTSSGGTVTLNVLHRI